MFFDETDKCRDIITVKHRHRRPGNRPGGGNGDNRWIVARQLGVIECQIADLDLVMGIALVALDDDQIARTELGQNSAGFC